MSGKENVRFPDSPDFDNLSNFRTQRDVRYSPIMMVHSVVVVKLWDGSENFNDLQ